MLDWTFEYNRLISRFADRWAVVREVAGRFTPEIRTRGDELISKIGISFENFEQAESPIPAMLAEADDKLGGHGTLAGNQVRILQHCKEVLEQSHPRSIPQRLEHIIGWIEHETLLKAQTTADNLYSIDWSFDEKGKASAETLYGTVQISEETSASPRRFGATSMYRFILTDQSGPMYTSPAKFMDYSEAQADASRFLSQLAVPEIDPDHLESTLYILSICRSLTADSLDQFRLAYLSDELLISLY